MCQYSSQDGFANDWHLAYLGVRRGPVFTEATAVTANGRVSPGDPGMYSDTHCPMLASDHGVRACARRMAGIQLAHAASKASTFRPWEGHSAAPAVEPPGCVRASRRGVAGGVQAKSPARRARAARHGPRRQARKPGRRVVKTLCGSLRSWRRRCPAGVSTRRPDTSPAQMQRLFLGGRADRPSCAASAALAAPAAESTNLRESIEAAGGRICATASRFGRAHIVRKVPRERSAEPKERLSIQVAQPARAFPDAAPVDGPPTAVTDDPPDERWSRETFSLGSRTHRCRVRAACNVRQPGDGRASSPSSAHPSAERPADDHDRGVSCVGRLHRASADAVYRDGHRLRRVQPEP